MKVLLIIPAYNEEANILRVCEELNKSNKDIDYIFINDGSKDSTLKILQSNNIPHLNLINNLGIGGAVQAGYKYAYENGYDIAIQFDGDGQHDIKYVEDICKPIEDNIADMVIGTRYLDKSASEFQSTFMRRLGSNVLTFIINAVSGKKITDPTSGFRAVNRKVLELFSNKYPTQYPEPESIVSVLRNDYRILEVPVNMKERLGGVSSINLLKSMDYMIKVSISIVIDRLRKND